MREFINQEDIDFYRKYGFVRIRELLDQKEVEYLKELQNAAVKQRSGYRFPPLDRLGREKLSHDLIFFQRLNLWRDFEPMREFSLNSRIAGVAATLAGVDTLRIWNDGCFRKEPWGNPTLWHFDVAYWSFNSPNGITLWVSLDGSTAQKGGLYFMPGSHHELGPDKLNFPEDRVAGLFEQPGYEKWQKVEPVNLSLNPGDCTFHNGLTLHGSGTNMTPYCRDAWTCSYMPDGSCFNGNQNILPNDYFNSLQLGDRLDNDDINPVVYRKAA